jgi:hypothetical protein
MNTAGSTETQWWVTKDGDVSCYELYRRHYPSKKNKRPQIKQFVGPGQSVVLRTAAADAVFVWRKFIDDCIDERTGKRQQGVNCAVFRNESGHRSSELIRQADAVADLGWPCERHYTYVSPQDVRGTNPGYCFICAGWRRCGKTKRGLLVLERLAQAVSEGL